MITDVRPEMMAMIKLERVDFGEELKAKSKDGMAAFEPIDKFL